MTDAALLAAMVAVESAWLTALAEAGVVPPVCAGADLACLVGPRDAEFLAAGAEDGGNPVLGLVGLLRERAPAPAAAWLHRGLTSQDVVDTALMLATRSVVDLLVAQLSQQISVLATLTATHRGTPMVARTLTQPAVPTTFGAKAAGWLRGLLDAYRQLTALATPIQIGGAAGTRAAITELAALTGVRDPGEVSARLVRAAATSLGLDARPPWHTTRTPVTAAADALLGCTDAWGRIAADVVVLARPEIGELSEPGGGGSSTMPDKHNPVLSILIRRAAIAAPPLAATLHTAAALANDERPDGAWHAEWDTLRTLARRTVVAGSQCGELLAGLQIHPEAMARNLAATDVLGEQRAIASLVGKPPSSTYFGAIDLLIDETLEHVRLILKENS
ncbi:3-carboxy-cis,cis-muconate cycloisomerase [Mycobacterium eburneum]|nr:3-carboxy-cis,cis-muconate cycloisomerase [Mycobacterium eburneum]